jgi:hypothetical protein
MKDVEDFPCFPTDIHLPSYDQWFRRYALSMLMNAAGILSWTDLEGTNYFEFLTEIHNETSGIFENQTCKCLFQISDEYLCVSCR